MQRKEYQDAFAAFSQGLQLDPDSDPLKAALQRAAEEIEASESKRGITCLLVFAFRLLIVLSR